MSSGPDHARFPPLKLRSLQIELSSGGGMIYLTAEIWGLLPLESQLTPPHIHTHPTPPGQVRRADDERDQQQL